ncbi:hypothetical protein CB1_000172029 [Camelus ferus]|nr:hypothetical protein CB1_000172029 [Camelus ferus]
MPPSSCQSHLLTSGLLLCSPEDHGMASTCLCLGTPPTLIPRLCPGASPLCCTPSRAKLMLKDTHPTSSPKHSGCSFPAPPTDHILSAVIVSPNRLFFSPEWDGEALRDELEDPGKAPYGPDADAVLISVVRKQRQQPGRAVAGCTVLPPGDRAGPPCPPSYGGGPNLAEIDIDGGPGGTHMSNIHLCLLLDYLSPLSRQPTLPYPGHARGDHWLHAPATDALKTSGKMPEGGRKTNPLQKSKGILIGPTDSSGVGKGDLQSTLLEGHGTAPPDLDLSAINDKSVVRKTPQLEKTMSKKAESSSFSACTKKSPVSVLKQEGGRYSELDKSDLAPVLCQVPRKVPQGSKSKQASCGF